MVPEPVIGTDGRSPDGESGPQSHPVLIRRVGPGTSMASDNAFAVALLTLWHRVSAAGGFVLFAPPVERSALAPTVSMMIDQLRSGRTHAVAATENRAVIGFALLRPDVGASAHTGAIEVLMVDPDRQRSGVGSSILQHTVDLAASLAVERVLVKLPAAAAVDVSKFFDQFGFAAAGRLPGWVRLADGSTMDQLLLTREVAPRTATGSITGR